MKQAAHNMCSMMAQSVSPSSPRCQRSQVPGCCERKVGGS